MCTEHCLEVLMVPGVKNKTLGLTKVIEFRHTLDSGFIIPVSSQIFAFKTQQVIWRTALVNLYSDESKNLD